LLLFTLFFGGDCVGRMLPKFKILREFINLPATVILGFCRIIFLIIYLLMRLPK